MTTLGRYLWKEWRDQRASFLMLLAVLVAVALFCALLVPESYVDDLLFVHVFGSGALVAFGMTVGGDLLPGEQHRDTLGFLQRLPAGLNPAFAAKLLVFVVGGILSLALGWGLAWGAARLATGHWPTSFSGLSLGLGLLGGAVYLLWLLPVSTWLTRRAPTGLATLLVAGLAVWPFWVWLLRPVPWYRPRPDEFAALAVLALGAPLVAAWLSFVRGYRFGRGALGACAVGLPIGLGLMTPSWAWTVDSIRTATRLDPEHHQVMLYFGYLARGGRQAYLFAEVDGEEATLRVDLATGETEWFLERLAAEGPSQEAVERVWIGERGFHAPTFEPLSPNLERRRREYGKSPFDPEQALEDLTVSACGLGYGLREGFYDPFRKRLFPLPFPRGRVLIRPGLWARAHLRAPWSLYDPELDEAVPLDGLLEGEDVLDVVPDGRLWVGGPAGQALLQPETGERVPLATPGWDGGLEHNLSPYDRRTTRGGHPLVVASGEDWRGLLLLGAEGRTVTRMVAPIDGVLDSGDGEELIYLERTGARVVRARFDSDEQEVLWPRHERTDR